MLRGPHLKIQEMVRQRTGTRSPYTYFRGSQPIDGAWCTDEIEMTEARLMPYCFGVGDHRAVIIDITEQSIYGDQTFKIVRLDARRLQWKIPQSVEA